MTQSASVSEQSWISPATSESVAAQIRHSVASIVAAGLWRHWRSQPEVLVIDGSRPDVTIRNMRLSEQPMQAALIRGAFSMPGQLSMEWASSQVVGQAVAANNGFFPQTAEAVTCANASSHDPNSRRHAKHTLLGDYLRLAVPTDYHVFQPRPVYALHRRNNQSRGTCHAATEASEAERCCCCATPAQQHFPPRSVQRVLYEYAYGSNSGPQPCYVSSSLTMLTSWFPRSIPGACSHVLSAVGPRLSPHLKRGKRKIFSAMQPGTAIHFHAHAATWFALTHGLKVWWLGGASLSAGLTRLGNDDAATNPCAQLGHATAFSQLGAPLALVVQRPGDVLVFGENVSHATCALELSLGIGSQMGYFRTPSLPTDAGVAPKCTSRLAPSC